MDAATSPKDDRCQSVTRHTLSWSRTGRDAVATAEPDLSMIESVTMKLPVYRDAVFRTGAWTLPELALT